MLNPKLPDAFIAMRKRKAISGFGVRKTSGIKIEAKAVLFGPIYPTREMFRCDFIAVHFFATELSVKSVQVETMFSRNEGKGLFQIGPQFIGGAGFAGVISRGVQSP